MLMIDGLGVVEMKARDEYYPLDLPLRNGPPPEKRHPSCPGCGREWTQMPQLRSVGGASVEGPVCRRCIDEMKEKRF